MDPVTHGLTGALLAETGFARRFGRQARLAMIGGALAPDVDIFWSPSGSVAALETHRGITHSFLGGLGIAVVVAGVVRLLGPEKRWGPLIGMSYLSLVLAHLFLDLITPYGIQLFLPFSTTRPAWDLVFIIDPFQTAPILLALLVTWFWPAAGVRPAGVGVVYLAAYFAFMAVGHHVALGRVHEASRMQGLQVIRAAALPQPFNPLEWLALVETPEVVGRGVVRLPSAAPLTFEQISRGDRDDMVRAIERLPEVQTFLWFARFPVMNVRRENGQQIVEYHDLRFGRRGPFRLRVILTEQGHVERILFGR